MKYVSLIFVIIFPMIANGMNWDLTHKFTNKNRYIDTKSNNNFTFDLEYQPDFDLDLWSKEHKKIDMQIVLKQTNSLDYLDKDWEGDIDLRLYRSLIRFSALNYELRLGLQQLNFGQAMILRPLQWFDTIDPRDENKESDGVYAFLAKRYFLDNSNMWGWVILDDDEIDDDTDFDDFVKQIEYGGRWQYPVGDVETGLSIHHKKLSSIDYSSETKLGFDLRKDYVLGFWAETSLSFLHGGDETANSSLLTAGADYTISVGNGIYLLLENLFISEIDDGFLPNKAKSAAFQIQYPVNLFDSVQSIVTYDWQLEQYNLFLSYARSYDYLTVYLNFYQTGEGEQYDYYAPMEASSAIELVLETKF